MIAERVVEVTVGVDDDRHRRRGQLVQVGQDLACLDMGGPRVDDEGLAIAEHDSDVLVEEGIAPHEDTICDLDPVHDVDDGRRRRSPFVH